MHDSDFNEPTPEVHDGYKWITSFSEINLLNSHVNVLSIPEEIREIFVSAARGKTLTQPETEQRAQDYLSYLRLDAERSKDYRLSVVRTPADAILLTYYAYSANLAARYPKDAKVWAMYFQSHVVRANMLWEDKKKEREKIRGKFRPRSFIDRAKRFVEKSDRGIYGFETAARLIHRDPILLPITYERAFFVINSVEKASMQAPK